jgi:hypothetical protein
MQWQSGAHEEGGLYNNEVCRDNSTAVEYLNNDIENPASFFCFPRVLQWHEHRRDTLKLLVLPHGKLHASESLPVLVFISRLSP